MPPPGSGQAKGTSSAKRHLVNLWCVLKKGKAAEMYVITGKELFVQMKCKRIERWIDRKCCFLINKNIQLTWCT